MRINFIRNVLPGDSLEEKVSKVFQKDNKSVVLG